MEVKELVEKFLKSEGYKYDYSDNHLSNNLFNLNWSLARLFKLFGHFPIPASIFFVLFQAIARYAFEKRQKELLAINQKSPQRLITSWG